MRRSAALLLAGILTIALCACGEEPPAVVTDTPPAVAESVRIPKPFSLAYDPVEELHPLYANSRVNRMLIPLVYEGLYALDGSFAPVPVLAAGSEVSGDGLTWTVTLKEGLCFSDGTPLTAGHVADTLNTARKSGYYADRLGDIRSVRASGDGVIITLTRANGALPALLDVPVLLEGGDPAPLGTGRYRFAESGEGLKLVANYNHGGELPYNTIPLAPVSDTAALTAAFDGGACSAVITDFASVYSPGYSCNFESWDYPSPDLIYVGFRASGGPCASPSVRRAISLAADRTAMVKRDLSGRGDETVLPIHPLSAGADAAPGYDPEGAAACLDEGGYVLSDEDGLRHKGRSVLSLTLLVNSDSPVKTAMAERLAEELRGLGAEVDLRSLPWKDYLAALTAGDFDLYIAEVRLTGDFDPAELLLGGLNYGGYTHRELTAALNAWRAASGEERTAAGETLWAVFAEEMSIAPICFKRESLLVRWDTVEGLHPIWGDPFHQMEQWQPVLE